MQSGITTRPLDSSFYDRDPTTVAEYLLGKSILRKEDGAGVTSATIIDTEAYGPIRDDKVADATGFRALREWPPGRLWSTYYMWGKPTFEVTTRGPGSVLVRGVMLDFAGNKRKMIRGPVSVAETLKVDTSLNKTDLTRSQQVSIHEDRRVFVSSISCVPRVNLRFGNSESRRFVVRFSDISLMTQR